MMRYSTPILIAMRRHIPNRRAFLMRRLRRWQTVRVGAKMEGGR